MNGTPSLSIVIPCLDEEQEISLCLQSLSRCSPDCEIIAVDGGSVDGTCDILAATPAIQLYRTTLANRALQMNFGAQKASGKALLFLHADTRMPSGFEARISEIMRDERNVGGSFRLKFDHTHWALRIIELVTRFNIKWITVGDHALFFRREVFDELNGYPEVPVLEDLELQLSARHMGPMPRIKTPVITSARRFLRYGIFRQIWNDIFILGAYYGGISPKGLGAYYPKHNT